MSYKFSKSSMKQLNSCHPRLQWFFGEVIKYYDCTIIEGHRSGERQNELYRTGQSKVEYPNSKHNSQPSMAVDVAPYPIDWNDTKRFYHFAGFVFGLAAEFGVNIRWGGDWDSDNDLNDQTFFDLVHFEVRVTDD